MNFLSNFSSKELGIYSNKIDGGLWMCPILIARLNSFNEISTQVQFLIILVTILNFVFENSHNLTNTTTH